MPKGSNDNLRLLDEEDSDIEEAEVDLGDTLEIMDR